MKILLPKPVSRDPNALDAKSRRAGAFRDKRIKREQQKLNKLIDESLNELADLELDDYDY